VSRELSLALASEKAASDTQAALTEEMAELSGACRWGLRRAGKGRRYWENMPQSTDDSPLVCIAMGLMS
jgi:hypothetical protein